MIKRSLRCIRRVGSVVRRIIGAPDYDHYLAHMRARHPDATPLSRELFMTAQLQARFEKPGAKCC